MKRCLLFTLFFGILLNAQVKERRNYCIKKDTYHHSYKDLGEIYTQYIVNYSPDYKRVLSIETKKPLEDDGFFVQFIDSLRYDDKDRLIESERFENIEGNFIKDNLEIYSYNERGDVDTLTSNNWDPDLNKYVKGRRYIHQYDEEGKLISKKWQAGRNYVDEWRELFVDRYTYNDDKLYQVQRKLHEDNGGAYLERTTFTYDEKGRQESGIREKYSGGWYYFEKNEFTYDDDDNVVSKVNYLYSFANDNWAPNFFWEAVEYDRQHLNSNTYSKLDDTIDLFPSKNVLLSYNAYGYDGTYQEWKKYTHNKIFYDFDVEVDGDGTNIVPVEEPKKEIKLYPNPTFDAFSIDSDETEGTVKVYDLSGSLLKNFTMLNDIYDVRSLKSGIYIVVFETKNDKKQFRIIKK